MHDPALRGVFNLSCGEACELGSMRDGDVAPSLSPPTPVSTCHISHVPSTTRKRVTYIDLHSSSLPLSSDDPAPLTMSTIRTDGMPPYLARSLSRKASPDFRPIVTISPGSSGSQAFHLDSNGEVTRRDTQIVADVRVHTVPGVDCTPSLAYACIQQAVQDASLTDYGLTELGEAISSALSDDSNFDFRVVSNDEAYDVESTNRRSHWGGCMVGSYTMTLHDPTSATAVPRQIHLMSDSELPPPYYD